MVISVDGFCFPVLGVLIATILTGFVYLKYFVFMYWTKRGVVQVEPIIPFGNIYDNVTGKISLGELFRDAYLKFKKSRIFGMYTLVKPQLVVADLDLIRTVMVKEFAHFHDHGMYCNEKVDPLSGNLFMLPGAKWRNLRVKLSPAFTSGKIKQMFFIIKEHGDELQSYIEEKAKGREVVEIKEIMARFSTDVIAATAFGLECNSMKNPNNEFRIWGHESLKFDKLKALIAGFVPELLYFLSIPMNKKGVTRFFTQVFKESFAYRKANNIKRNDFFDLLRELMEKGYVRADKEDESTDSAETKGDENMEKLTEMEAIAQAFLFFQAGFETSSTTVSHCLFELSKHQEIQDKLREEIATVTKQYGGLTYESLHQMKYLHTVVSETLRMYPPLPFLSRVCTKEIDLPGVNVHVEKGTSVLIPVYGLHHDPEIYPDPESFIPERFDEENIAKRHPYSYLPFGEGPRICIGMRFGLMQTKIGIINLISKFRVKLGPNTSEVAKMSTRDIILTHEGGLHLRIELA